MLLKIFLSSMIVVLAFNIPAMTGAFASEGIPAIGDAGWRWTGHILLVVLIEAAVFWSGILRIYLTANQLGMKYRLIGILCGWIPIVNIICLGILLRITDKEIKVENDKIILNESRASQKICETKYPILMVHGVFFRDFDHFNYWGRTPKELERNGAKLFYGEHGGELLRRLHATLMDAFLAVSVKNARSGSTYPPDILDAIAARLDEARRFFDGCGDDLLRRRFKIMAYPLEFELDRQRGIHAGTVKEPERRLRFIAGDE